MRISDWSSDVCSSDLGVETSRQDAPLRPLHHPSGGPPPRSGEELATPASGRNLPRRPSPPVGADPCLDPRRDVLAPFAAVEDAIMAAALPPPIFLLFLGPRLGTRPRRLGDRKRVE